VLKIGEFSSLSKIPITTLRHYDELGLLTPVHVDAENGYRYYSVNQLPRLHRILALRDLGFPLERVADALEEGVNADTLKGMLLLRSAEQERQVREETERLARLKALLQLIEREGKMTGDVVVKEIGSQWIVSLRESIPAYRAIGQLFGKLYRFAGPLGIQGTGVALLHDSEFKEQDVDAEAGIYLKHEVKVGGPLKCYELPPVSVASVVHHGAFEHIAEAYGALLRWIETNNYQPAGATREIFLHLAMPVMREDPSNVTEIQVPVEKS
jgi:DNA-binding transcriptional MerR regulator